MTDARKHDPLCPVVHSAIECGYCALIARVREDQDALRRRGDPSKQDGRIDHVGRTP